MLSSTQFKTLDIQDLLPGMVIIRVVKQNGPIKIKKSGLVTSPDMVQGLIEMGIQQVEIDPNQTVEFESASHIDPADKISSNDKTFTTGKKAKNKPVKKSATQKMLDSNSVANGRIEDNLSSQFHRSLFLPTVQGIPTAWQYFGRKYAVAAIIALGGFGLGWTLANYQLVLALFPAQPAVVKVTTSPVQQPDDAQQLDLPQIDDVTTAKSAETLEVNSEASVIKSAKPVVSQPTTPQVALVETKVLQAEQGSLEIKEEANSTQNESDQEEVRPFISADLLKKFNQAIVQVSESTADGSAKNSLTSQENQNTVPRIDQLSAWVLTELPSMSFSAHMYASEQNERWVRVNGTRMVEGDVIDKKVRIVSIEPQHVILKYASHEFSMAALTDW